VQKTAEDYLKMNWRIFFRLLSITPLLSTSAKSQPDHFVYAVTSVNKGENAWVALRKMDTRTGDFSNILLNLQDNNSLLPATGSSVAAIAYDRKANRIYYVQMNNDQLHYIDLSTMESFAVSDQFFSRAGKYDTRNAGPINRMVIAPDEYGYTITNDGEHLIKFTTNGSPVLTDLGGLQDDPLNKEMTIHSPCTNSGGDLIADDAGHLYLITGTNKVYKVDIATRVTSYLAMISGLPQKFTTSGVAVSEDGKKLYISSSTYADAFYLIDPETWQALPLRHSSEMYESADLANSNILYTKAATGTGLFVVKSRENMNRILIFPNPVLNDEISIQFNEMEPDNYTIQLTSELGGKVIQQKATISAHTQTEIMHIPRNAAQGFYYLRILDGRNNVVGTQKLVLERW
jgi:hypothetical protein